MTEENQADFANGGSRRRHVKIAGRSLRVPASPVLRIALGVVLVCGGLLGFLPVLGFWMVPLGLIVLSVDLPPVRRWRRQVEVRLGRWWASQRGRSSN